MVYLLIDSKIKFNVSNLNNKELMDMVNQLQDHDLKIMRVMI